MGSVDTVGDKGIDDPVGPRPLMRPGWSGAVAYFVGGALLLGAKVVAFMTPAPYSGARLVPADQASKA